MDKIVWYGERGVVNSLILSIIEKGFLKEFLSCIKWADNSKHQWISEITNTTYIIEVGLNDFGTPDLILICKDNCGNTYVIFLEAKTGTYIDNAISNEEGMVEGYNSGINGQLSLKYRFCKAIKKWNGKENEIVEPSSLYKQYKEEMLDPRGFPRRLKHSVIIQNILVKYGIKTSFESCFFVALTIEKDSFSFSNVIEKFLPVFLSEKGENIWDQISTNVGLLDLRKVKELDLSDEFNETYNQMHSIIESSLPAEEFPNIRTINLEEFPEPVNKFCIELFDYILSVSQLLSGKKLTGSYSIIGESGNVLIKIFPKGKGDDEILIGLRYDKDWCPETKIPFLSINSIQKTPFRFYQIAPEELKTYEKPLKDLIKQLLQHY